MELTAAHLRYLLAIYDVSQTHLDICSRSIAEKLGVTKPSVVRIMNLLMERGMIVKEHYGKIYLTDRGIFVAKEVKKQLETVLANFPPVKIEMTDDERCASWGRMWRFSGLECSATWSSSAPLRCCWGPSLQAA